MKWAIVGEIVCSARPGYTGEFGRPVQLREMDTWMNQAKMFGVKSIICLLDAEHLVLYSGLPSSSLIEYYKAGGIFVAHIPVSDYEYPPLTDQQLNRVWEAYTLLEKPILLHCSAGQNRSRHAIEFIKKKILTESDLKGDNR
jgi:hypothetical protein